MVKRGSGEHASGAGTLNWAVFGATGFVGEHVTSYLRRSGEVVLPLRAPRLGVSVGATAEQLLGEMDSETLCILTARLAAELSGHHVVVNAAGLATPDARRSPALVGANGMLPGVIALASGIAGVRRFIHVSSAAVQDRRDPLDESAALCPRSPYAYSKALGEEVLLRLQSDGRRPIPEIVVLRATSVQGAERATTAKLTKLARSRWSTVAGPHYRPTPVVTAQQLADTIGVIGTYPGLVPNIVLQPWSGITNGQLLKELGGRDPWVLPRSVCRGALSAGYALSSISGGHGRAIVRRMELLWFGQRQVPGWVTIVRDKRADQQ